jgi:hypothetical protein
LVVIGLSAALDALYFIIDFDDFFVSVRGVPVPSLQVYPNDDKNGNCGDEGGFVWFWGYDGTTPGPTVYVPTNKRHDRWGNNGANGGAVRGCSS